MSTTTLKSSAVWRADDLERDKSWIFELDENARRDLLGALEKARDPDKTRSE